MNDGKIGSDYQHTYVDRTDKGCPHCDSPWEPIRTNRYLFRCTNYTVCGRYW